MVYRSFSTCFKLCEQWNSITKCPSDLVATSICLKALVILERDGRFNTPTTSLLDRVLETRSLVIAFHPWPIPVYFKLDSSRVPDFFRRSVV